MGPPQIELNLLSYQEELIETGLVSWGLIKKTFYLYEIREKGQNIFILQSEIAVKI